MQIYWTLKQIPELAGLSRRERGHRWRAAYMRALRHWQTLVGLVACGLCAGAGSVVGGLVGTQLVGSIIGAGIGGGIGGLVFSQVAIWVARRYYKSVLLGVEFSM